MHAYWWCHDEYLGELKLRRIITTWMCKNTHECVDDVDDGNVI